MYKIFEVTYNDGGWRSGSLPHFFYIAKTREDVIEKSEKYQEFLRRKQTRGGDIWIQEVSELIPNSYFENLKDFNIKITIKKNQPNKPKS